MNPETMLASLSYLLGFYWPYLAGALAIGIAAGWFSRSTPEG
jgi:hypothetical protein